MNSSLRIAIADDEPDMREFLRESLERMGHQIVSVAENGAQLVSQAKLLGPDLVITDIKMSDMDGLAAAGAIYAEKPVPLILVSAYSDRECLERAQESHVLAYLVKPIRESNLGPAIAIVMRRFEELEELRRETHDLKQALSDRKIIERAKGLLMKQARLDEGAAFRRLQSLASSKNRKLIEIARMIVETADAWVDPKGPVT